MSWKTNEDLTGFYSSPPISQAHSWLLWVPKLWGWEITMLPIHWLLLRLRSAEARALCSWSSFPGEELQGSISIFLSHMLELFSSMGVWWADTCMLKEKNFPLVLLFSRASYHNRTAGTSRSSTAAEVAKQDEHIWRHCQSLSAASFSGQRRDFAPGAEG